jgi:beta-mannosidase
MDPRSVRHEDMQRYLAISRVVTGEVLASVLGEWRRGGSTCRGALLWLFQDPWPGAGWGLIDSTGRAKAAYYAVRRVLQPVAVVMTDEGLNGLALHAINDTGATVEAELEIALYAHGEVVAASGRSPVTLAPRSSVTKSSDALLGQFLDVSCAYRFGPTERDVVVGTLREREGRVLGRAFHFPRGHRFEPQRDLGLSADVRPGGNGEQLLSLRTQRFAQAVAIDACGYIPDDNYFHIEPWGERTVVLRPSNGARDCDGSVQPLNALVPTKIVSATREVLR